MLRSFRVANHKSFRDEAELLLLPAYDKSRPVVPVAGIFGANASGKSNLLDALRWLRSAVLDSYGRWEPGAGVPRTPFRLDPELAAQPSWYSVEVVVDGERYSYGVEIDDQRVTEEWLYTYPRNRRRVIFERKGDAIRLGSTVGEHRSRGELLARNTRSNALFLAVAAYNDLTEVAPVFRWLQTGIAVNPAAEVEEALLHRMSGADRPRMVALIRAADLGIQDITVRHHVSLPVAEAEQLFGYLRASTPADDSPQPDLMLLSEDDGMIVAEAKRTDETGRPAAVTGKEEAAAALARTAGPSGRIFITAPQVRSLQQMQQGLVQQTLVFHHGSHGGVLTFDEQSAGTKSWISLVLRTLQTLEYGGVLVVDEVDSSLHPHLTSRLIELFREPETNPRHAQLLFTTHDATLLDEETLARDEIWFVEKNPDSGTTALYPLTDFRPRKHENVEGRYLAGGYGAVPVLTYTQFRKAIERDRSHRAAA